MNDGKVVASRRSTGLGKIYADQLALERRIMEKLDAAQRASTDAVARVDLLHAAVQRVETGYATVRDDVKRVILVLGEEREDGAGKILGTGLIGRVHRAENSVNKLFGMYRGWLMFGMGFCMAAGSLTAALWWVVGDKLAIVLKAH